MINRRIVLALALCTIVTSSTAFAGGTGVKKDSTISVRNDTKGATATPIAAFVDPDPAKIAALPAAPTEAQIIAAGGQLINPGATKSFKVAGGTYLLAAGTNPAAPAQVNVVIGKGQTKKYAYSINVLNPF